jgi:hypothetical protein
MLRREDNLRFTVTVAQIDENYAAQVAPRVNPATERDRLTDVCST